MTIPTPPLLPLASAPAATRTDIIPDAPAVYQVTGMTCGHCVNSVTEAVRALPRVDNVQIHLAAGGVSTVTVTGPVPSETVRRAIEEAGYTVLS